MYKFLFILLYTLITFYSEISSQSILPKLAKEGNLDGIKRHLKMGKSINELWKDSQDNCFNGLMKAKTLEIAQFFVDSGIDLNYQIPEGEGCSNEGVTALYVQSYLGNTNIVEYLISQGAKMNLGEYSCSPLWIASSNGDLPMVQLLIQKGSDVNHTCGPINLGMTPLHIAAKEGWIEIVKYLIEKKADYNRVDNAGFAPLDYAISEDRSPVKYYLRQIKAKQNRPQEF